jgi:hypothetical protein
MLTIRVGKDSRKDFTVHDSFLISRSEFFRRAMNGSWKEAETRIVNLPDDSTHIFGLYLNFVYTGKFNTMRKSEQELHRLDETTFKNHIEHEYQDLFRIYVLAEKLQDISAKNAAITAAIEVSQVAMRDGSWIPPSFVTANNVYEGTPEGSLGRRLVMDMCGTVPLSYVVDQIHKYKFTSDFVSDLGKVLERTREMKSQFRGNVMIKNGVQVYLEEPKNGHGSKAHSGTVKDL